MYEVVSFAKLQTYVSFIKRSKSFMKLLNKVGPNIDPWGTPRIISNHSLREEPIFTCCYLFDRQFRINLRLPSFSPYAAYLAIISSWLAQSYALERSINKVPKIPSGLSRVFFHFWNKFTSAYLVLYPFLKPHKRGKRNLFENFVSWSNHILSNILDIVGSTLTGL